MPGRAFCATSSTTGTAPAIWWRSCPVWKSIVPEPSQPPSWGGASGRLAAGRAEIAAAEIIATSELPQAWQQQVESIFFEASGRTFAPGPDRDWFRYRWLGRYLDAPEDPVLVAIVGDAVAGYLV